MIRPRISVVVASSNSREFLGMCLHALRPQCAQIGAELIVARSATKSTEELTAIAEGCRLVAAPPNASVPCVRAAGLAHASGDWVALTEDHCMADANWISALMATASSDVHVLGGPIGNAKRERATDCGAFFAEYGIYGGRRAGAALPHFAAANVAYHRSIVQEVAARFGEGEWENEIHGRLLAASRGFRFVSDARVRQNKSYQVGTFCRNRFEHGREYARVRARLLSRWRRAALFAATPALPALLAARIAQAVGLEELPDFWRALPATLVFLSAWATGEAMGYVQRTRAR